MQLPVGENTKSLVVGVASKWANAIILGQDWEHFSEVLRGFILAQEGLTERVVGDTISKPVMLADVGEETEDLAKVKLPQKSHLTI